MQKIKKNNSMEKYLQLSIAEVFRPHSIQYQ